MRARVIRLSPLQTDILLAVLFALLAHAMQTFQFNRLNNVYHIPIVLDWHLDPLFAGEAFVQALQSFATPFYILLRPFADADSIETVFHLLFSACRGLTLYALLQVGRGCGLPQGWRIPAFAAVVAAGQASYGASPVGDGALFASYMTHTEFAQAFALLAIGLALRDRPAGAGLAAGLAFAINAFVGVWTLVPLGGLAVIDMLRGGLPGIRRWVIAGCCFALPAAPVALWILGAQTQTTVAGFDYKAFLQFYYGQHFFIGWAGWGERLRILLVMIAGLLALPMLLPRWRPGIAWLLFAAIFLVGIAVGQLASSRLLLNLHLLRSAGMLMWLTIAVVTAACLLRGPAGRPLVAAASVVALAGLILGAWWLAAAAMVLPGLGSALAVARSARVTPRSARVTPRSARVAPDATPPAQGAQDAAPPMGSRAIATAAAVLAALALLAWTLPGADRVLDPRQGPTRVQLEGSAPVVPDWLALKTWVAANTPAEARFLIPLEFADFLTGTRRRIQVAMAEGAPVMWAPQTYHDWRRRLDEVLALKTEEDAIAYARTHGIDYIVFDKRPRRDSGPAYAGRTPAVFENAWFAVVRVPR